MENILTIKKRDEFFEFLTSAGLDPIHNSAILEVAPNVISSQSIPLLEKYGELYEQFLVTKRYGGSINGSKRDYYKKVASSFINSVDGIFGEVMIINGQTCIYGYDNPYNLNLTGKGAGKVQYVYKGTYIPRDCNIAYRDVAYNTLLIQGQPEEAYNLCMSELDLLFGDTCEIGNREVRRFYEDLLRTIQKYNPNGEDYDLIRDESRNRSSDAYLIKRMYK